MFECKESAEVFSLMGHGSKDESGARVIWEEERIRRNSMSVLTDHYPVGEDEELHIWSEGTEHQASCHHHAAENGHGTSPKVVHAGAADGTCREDRKTED